MKKGFKFALIIIGCIILAIVLVLGYLGFVPGVSALFGSSTPRDLGVKYTGQNLLSAYAKVGGDFQELSATKDPRDSLKYSGSQTVNTQLTNEEMTAMANAGKWVYKPTSDVQIRVNDDGTVEASGKIIKKNLPNFAKAHGFSDDDISKLEAAIILVPGNPIFYVKGKASVINNHASLDVEQAEIGRIDAKNYISPGMAESIIDQGINHVPGTNIRSATFENGNMKLDATLPSKISRVIQ